MPTFPAPHGAAAVPAFVPAPPPTQNSAFGAFTFPNPGTNSWIWYTPFRIPRRLRVTGLEIELTSGTANPAGSGDKGFSICLYRDVEWEGGIGQAASALGRWVPLNKLYEEEWLILDGGVYRGNTTFELSTPQVLDPYPGREGGNLFYIAGQLAAGWSSATVARAATHRSTHEAVHVRSEIGAYPLAFQDNPTGAYKERAETISPNGSALGIDLLNLYMELRTEPA